MLTERYHIVPKGSGYHYLCVDLESGGHILWHKAEDLPIGIVALDFPASSVAERYIKKKLPQGEYKVEAVLVRKEV